MYIIKRQINMSFRLHNKYIQVFTNLNMENNCSHKMCVILIGVNRIHFLKRKNSHMIFTEKFYCKSV